MRPWIGPECNNGIGGQGFNQKKQGRIGIKDPDAKLQLHPWIEQMSDGIDVKIFRLEIKKRLKDGKRLRKNLECNRGLRDAGVRLALCLKKKRTTNAIKGWSAGQR
jgi:hypothetical protein